MFPLLYIYSCNIPIYYWFACGDFHFSGLPTLRESIGDVAEEQKSPRHAGKETPK